MGVAAVEMLALMGAETPAGSSSPEAFAGCVSLDLGVSRLVTGPQSAQGKRCVGQRQRALHQTKKSPTTPPLGAVTCLREADVHGPGGPSRTALHCALVLQLARAKPEVCCAVLCSQTNEGPECDLVLYTLLLLQAVAAKRRD